MSEDIVRRLRWLMGSEAGCKDLRIAMIAKLAIDEIERLRTERDEARCEMCMVVAGKCGKSAFVSRDAVEEAKRRGWDCFQKATR